LCLPVAGRLHVVCTQAILMRCRHRAIVIALS
jgi:hypothetical protein